MKFLKFALIPVLALAALPLCAGQPKVSASAQEAVLYRPNGSKALAPIVDAVVAGFNRKSARHTGAKDRIDTFAAESGLSVSDIRWVAVSAGDLKSFANGPDAFTATVEIPHDFARVEKALRTLDEGIVETTVAGQKTLKTTQTNQAEGLFVTSLKGQLLLAAASEKDLADQIALYGKDGKTAPAFAGLGKDKNAMVSLRLTKLGELAGKMVPTHMIEQADLMLPNGKAMMLGLGTLDVSLAGVGDTATVRISVAMRNETDAQTMLGVLNVFKSSAATGGEDLPTKLVGALKLSAKGNVLRAELPLSAEDVKALCEMGKRL